MAKLTEKLLPMPQIRPLWLDYVHIINANTELDSKEQAQ